MNVLTQPQALIDYLVDMTKDCEECFYPTDDTVRALAGAVTLNEVFGFPECDL